VLPSWDCMGQRLPAGSRSGVCGSGVLSAGSADPAPEASCPSLGALGDGPFPPSSTAAMAPAWAAQTARSGAWVAGSGSPWLGSAAAEVGCVGGGRSSCRRGGRQQGSLLLLLRLPPSLTVVAAGRGGPRRAAWVQPGWRPA
jgi:hypothetical protein